MTSYYYNIITPVRTYVCTYVPEGVDTVDDSRHVLSVVQVGRDWIEDLNIGTKLLK